MLRIGKLYKAAMKLSPNRLFFFFLVATICPLEEAYAQKEVLYEQYIQNPMAINPAFTGVREDFNMSVLLRRRWFLLPNSPISQTFAMDGTIAGGKVGIGLQALSDRMSPYFTTGVYGSAAYHLNASADWKISLGIQGGINVLPVYDFASNTSVNRALGSLGAGVWIHSEKYYLGISKPELLSQGYGSRQTTFEYRQPLYVTAGATFEAIDLVKITPSILIVQEAGTNLRVDAGARAWYDEKIGIGLFFRSARVNYIQASGELQVSNNVRVGYTYNSKAHESGITGTGNNLLSMHELMLKLVPNPSRFHIN
jgi:type IX secretion system PorP/SprF family membrane protein